MSALAEALHAAQSHHFGTCDHGTSRRPLPMGSPTSSASCWLPGWRGAPNHPPGLRTSSRSRSPTPSVTRSTRSWWTCAARLC